MKLFKFEISTRLKIIIFSFLLVFIQVLLEVLGGRFLQNREILPYLQAAIVGLFFYILAWIALRFRRNRSGHLYVILPTAISVFFVSAFGYLVFNQLGVRIIYRTISILSLFIFLGYFYVVLLMVNILFKSIINPLPLAKAARTAMYLTSVFSIFIASVIFVSLPIHPIFPIIFVGAIVFIYIFVNLWFTELRDRDSIRLAFLGTVVVMFAVFVLLNWPITSIYIALFVSIFAYIFIGIIVHILSGTLNRGVWLEYIFLIFIALVIILKVSDWGINKIPFI